MALIDVSDILLDPDFVDSIQIYRRLATVNDFGKTEITTTIIETVGSVQPASAKTLSRLPDELRMEDVRSFYVKIPLLIDGTSTYPDIIVFGGARFQIRTAAPWLNFGNGWNEGLCVREKATL